MRRLIVSAFLCLAFAIGFTVCAWANVDDRVYPTAISIPESIEIDRNDVRTIRPVLTPINAETDLDYFSQDSSIAEFLPSGIGDTGNVVGINAGETVLTVTADNGLSASCNVKVNYRPDPESITIPTEYTLKKNDFWDIPISLYPQDSTARYDIESDNEIVASTAPTGSNNGVRVHGEAPGTATITVRTFSGLEATCFVTVIDALDPESISIPERHEMFEGESWNVPISLTPEGVKTQFSITTSDSRVTRVTTTGAYNGCRVYAGIAGSAEITIATKNGLEAKCLVTVLSNQNDGDSPSQIDDKDQIYYIDENGLAQEPISEYEIINSETTELNDSWVVVSKSVNNTNRLTVNGNVNLLLCDGVTLNLPKGIAVTENNSLTIYGQSAGTGTLNINKPENNAAGIGGNWNAPSGIICICGGTIKVQGAAFAAGIGGGGGRRTNYSGDASGGRITIKGGSITANGGTGTNGAGAGIGGGYRGSGGVITISGGTIIADGGLGGAGIGGGCFGSGGSITISGGEVNARGNGTAASIGGGIEGFGGTICITGGSVTAVDSGTGSSIGSGSDAEGGHISITGGQIIAGAIGSSEYSDDEATITLGWTNETDFIQATKYRGMVSIAEGYHLVIEDNPSMHFEGNGIEGKLLSNTKLIPDLRIYHRVNIINKANGTISANCSEAVKDDIIILTAIPVAGYNLTSVTVIDENGMPVALTDLQFTMPDTNVTVTATFASQYRATGSWGDNLTWTLDDEGLLTIIGSGQMRDFGDHEDSSAWRKYLSDIKSVKVGTDITSIGNSAFRECRYLKNVVIPSSVNRIGNQAFSLCSSLTGVALPNGVETIDYLAFGYCSSLLDVFIPSSVKTIGFQAFAFSENLKSAILGSGLTEIGSGAFRMCSTLNSIKVDDRNEVFCDVDGVLFDKNVTTLICFPDGRNGTYYIPASVTVIADSAFALAEKLEGVVLPEGVLRIGQRAFQFCGIKNITLPASIILIDEAAFTYCDKLTDVHFEGPLELWNMVDIKAQNDLLLNADIHFLKPDFILPASLIAIDENAFSGGAFTFVQLPDNALSIGSGAFANCQKLRYIIIPENVDDIADTAFENEVTIIGVPGSTAYEYASSKNIQFIPIG